jgi:hypothetical protein
MTAEAQAATESADNAEGKTGAEDKATAANDKGEDHGIDTSDSLLNDAENVEVVDFSKGMPKDFPKEAWDDEKKAPKAEVLYDKFKEAEARAKGLRDKLAKGEGKAPKDPKEYAFKPGEKGAKLFKDGDASKDPLIAAAAPIAHKYGISKEAYQGFLSEMSDFIADKVGEAQEAGPAELSPEQKAEIRTAEYKKIGTNAPQIIKAVETWGKELKETGQFSEADIAAFKSMAVTGEQVRVLNKLRALAGGGNHLPMDFSGDGLASDDEIANLQAAVKTQADQDKVDELYEKRRQAGRPEKLQIRV